MKWMGKKTMSAMLALAMACTVGASGTLMASAAAGTNKISADDPTQSSANGGWSPASEPGEGETFVNNNDGQDVTTGEASYSVPVTLRTITANYQVTLEWGDFALVYDATASTGSEWQNSFDGTNNIVTATNTGKQDISVSMAYDTVVNQAADINTAVEGLHLGLTGENNGEYAEGSNIDGQEFALAAATESTDAGTKSEYLNLRDDYAAPTVSIANATQIGTITILVKPVP